MEFENSLNQRIAFQEWHVLDFLSIMQNMAMETFAAF